MQYSVWVIAKPFSQPCFSFYKEIRFESIKIAIDDLQSALRFVVIPIPPFRHMAKNWNDRVKFTAPKACVYLEDFQ
ncbi:hypothetical protein BLK93_21165 [Klebsiella pneumoniae]|nr:hypothetical protein BLK93_21165 [Klebsiella pneumoniae]